MHICSRHYLIRRRCDRQARSVKELSQPDDRDGISLSEKRISQRAFIAEKKNRPRIVKATLRSIYCGLLNYLDESIRRFVFVCKQGMN